MVKDTSKQLRLRTSAEGITETYSWIRKKLNPGMRHDGQEAKTPLHPNTQWGCPGAACRVLACLACLRARVPSSALQKGLGGVDKHTGEAENRNVVHMREAKSFWWWLETLVNYKPQRALVWRMGREERMSVPRAPCSSGEIFRLTLDFNYASSSFKNNH